MIVRTVTGASWAGEEEPQRAKFNGLAGPGFIEGNGDHVHLICTSSTVMRRVCKSMLQAETLACLWGVESGARVRAAIADARGMPGAGKKLPTNSDDKPAVSMRHLWMTYCKSLEEHLIAPTIGKAENKRLSIALRSLR
eukprot:9478060-Pyramimonas_sp.AAC.1